MATDPKNHGKPWTDADLEFQARHVAGMVAQNASFNCNAAKVLVVAKGWARKQAFLDRVREALRRTPARKAYYPGAQERYQAFVDRYPQAQAVGEKREGVVPWTVIPDVPGNAGEYALNTEAFCGVAITRSALYNPAARISSRVARRSSRIAPNISPPSNRE